MSKTTLTTTEAGLKALARKTNLNNPIETAIAISRYKTRGNKRDAGNGWKKKLSEIYNHYCNHFGMKWDKPTYHYEARGIQPPTNQKAEILMTSARMPLSLKIDISKQTGLRPIEIVGDKGLRVKDIHPDQKTITALNTKGCNARPPIKISDELNAKLQTYITENKLTAQDILFNQTSEKYSENFRRFKINLAKKLNDPSITTIRLYDLRHAYITKQLIRTQNCEAVRIMVGHKNLNTTQKYLHLLAGTNGEWITEGTTDTNRAKQLLTEDFTYQLTAPDGTMLFRKPK